MSITPGLKRFFIFDILALLVGGIILYQRPLPPVSAVNTLKPPAAEPGLNLPWPDYGQSAYGAAGYGVLVSHNPQNPAPMASVTKAFTALAVLKQKPLAAGQQGPLITITDEDVAIYNNYYSQGGSVVKVTVGEQISQYQAFQALLLPSSNNMADTLARWAFGSVSSYLDFANKMAKSLGLSNTHLADASGLSPDSVSSASDLVLLGQAVLSNSLISQVVSQDQANIPVAGTIQNTNWLLGSDGIVGIKTGQTEQAGGVFLFAAKRSVQNNPVTVIGAIMGALDLNKAISDARTLVRAGDSGFSAVAFAKANQTVGYYQAPWGAKSSIVPKKDLSILSWKGAPTGIKINSAPLEGPAAKDSVIGSLDASAGQQKTSTQLVLAQNLPGPSWTWRIFR